MKKILMCFAVILMFTGCQSENYDKQSDDKNDNGISVSNTEDLLNFAFEFYTQSEINENILTLKEFLEPGVATVLIDDYNKDGVDDALIYSNLENEIKFGAVLAVTTENDEYKLMTEEIDSIYIDYVDAQSFAVEGDYLIRYVTLGQESITIDFGEAFILDSEGILSTGGTGGVVLGGEEYYNDRVIITEVTKDGDWDSFTNNIKIYYEDTKEVISTYVYKYELDKDLKLYNNEIISIEEVAMYEYPYPREKMSEEEFKDSDFAKNRSSVYSEYIESNENRMLIGLEDETFGEQTITYANNLLVVIPMYDTINAGFTSLKQISFEGENYVPLKFTVFGQLEDVVVSLYETIDSEPKTQELGELVNTQVIVLSELKNDMSRIEVTGRFHAGEGTYHDVKFTLDNMRNLEEYSIITY